MNQNHGFGIDIGGTGIKGAPVDLSAGEFAANRVRIPTPEKSTPKKLIEVVIEVLKECDWSAPFGCTFPGIVRQGVIGSATNVDTSWIGVNLEAELSERTGYQVTVINDADAAGVAEDRFGAAADAEGTVIATTLGTGIGSAILRNGVLVPNTELGQLELHGMHAEKWAANSIREDEKLSWKHWAHRLQKYYSLLEDLFSPDLFVVGGGVSKKADKFLPRLDLQTPIVPMALLNDAGIIGAALVAGERSSS
jgi:polyphosphate glucokinase